MRKQILSLTLTLVLCLSLVPAAAAAGGPAVSDNRMTAGYGSSSQPWSQPITSYLFENAQGNLTRVEYISQNLWRVNGTTIETKVDNTIVVEDYSPDFHLLSSRTIPMELSIWGGFFAGERYNFFIFGQNNPQESDSVEVVRVVKYDKDWNRLGQASLYGADTFTSIGYSSVACAEYGDVLYVRTGHEMYHSSDGKNHQSNMTFTLRQSTMTMSPYERDPGYVSHSFKQLILIDSKGNIIGADHGDGYPRAFRLTQYKAKAGDLNLLPPVEVVWNERYPTHVDFNTFPGNKGNNTTHGRLQGLVEVTDGYLVAYTYRNNVYLAHVSRSDLAENHEDDGTARLHMVSAYDSQNLAANRAYGAAIVPTSLSGGYVIWAEQPMYSQAKDKEHYGPESLFYTTYSADGSTGPIRTFPGGSLSDCQPIVYQGKVVWYQTENSAPTFYTLDASGNPAVIKANGTHQAVTPGGSTGATGSTGSTGSSAFTDVAANSPYKDAIAWAVERGITNGTSANTFSPNEKCTIRQVVTFLCRASGQTGASMDEAEKWAVSQGIIDDRSQIDPSIPCSRVFAATCLWRAAGSPKPSKTVTFSDVHPNEYLDTGMPVAISWAVEKGITNGTGADTFSPNDTCTRGQIVTFLYRARS